MKMYAACLASYNNGRHHGEWFDLTAYDDAEELQADIARQVLVTSKFPNVFVECPCCEGSGAITEGGFKLDDCGQCLGRGTVPSSEEWAAHDYDGEGLNQFGEYPNLEKLLEHVRLVEEHGDAWLAYVEWIGENNASEENFEDCHLGDCENAEAYFTEQLEESGELREIPQHLRGYFDFAGYARDQELNGHYVFVEYGGTTYVFTN
ncbi:antirestriction protein ArdA [Pseudomonas sp. B14(2017)]|uniref:antirestriction protein ArdA n=1 Tax=Pseudomonas sp. B14(2017) TaxID=1981745 RepID=UPI000A1F9E4D|nr:antirestriction protein ArdA [Pseudomonas sp. B14(2017)]